MINRSDIVDSIGVEIADIRSFYQTTLEGTSLLNTTPRPKLYKVRILFVGTLQRCFEQFSEISSPNNIKIFRNISFE